MGKPFMFPNDNTASCAICHQPATTNISAESDEWTIDPPNADGYPMFKAYSCDNEQHMALIASPVEEVFGRIEIGRLPAGYVTSYMVTWFHKQGEEAWLRVPVSSEWDTK